MVLKLVKTLDMPSHASGGFDHGDVFEKSGIGFVAHTGNGAAEMYDGLNARHLRTIPGVPEASGVLCAQDETLAFAAARGTGKILVLDGSTGATLREFQAGQKPNGVAYDSKRRNLLIADVGDYHLRIADTRNGSIVADEPLSGKPRWCKYSPSLDRFIVNIHDQSIVAIVHPENALVEAMIPLSISGAHGIDVDELSGFAYVACDGGALISVDLVKKKEIKKVEILPNPDVAWLNINRGLLYCANSKPGVVQVVDVNEMRLTGELMTEEGCHTIAFHQKSQMLHAYLPKSCKVAFYRES